MKASSVAASAASKAPPAAVVAKAASAAPAPGKIKASAPASKAPAKAAPAPVRFDVSKYSKTMWIRLLVARDPKMSLENLSAALKAGGLDISKATISTIRIDAQRTIEAMRLEGRYKD
jgi:hypothetical protein